MADDQKKSPEKNADQPTKSNDAGHHVDDLMDQVESFDQSNDGEGKKELSPKEREAIHEKTKEMLSGKTKSQLARFRRFMESSKNNKGKVGELHMGLQAGETNTNDVDGFVAKLEQGLEDPKKIQEEESQGSYDLHTSEFESIHGEISTTRAQIGEKLKQYQEVADEIEANGETDSLKEQKKKLSDEIEKLEGQHHRLDEERIKNAKDYYTSLLWRKTMLEKKQKAAQDGGEALTDEEKTSLDDMTKKADEIHATLKRFHELSKKNERTQEEAQEFSDIRNDKNPVVSGLIDGQVAQDIDVNTALPIENDRVQRNLDNGYKADKTEDIIGRMEQLEDFESAKKRVEQVKGAFEKNGIGGDTLAVLENMLWRHAENNKQFRVENDQPFLAQDVSTQQAFIYYPGGKIEVSRAYHGSGKIGDNRHGKHGTTLGSKALSEGHKGGNYRYRLYIKGLEEGVNHNDHDRLVRMHEKNGGNTIGCTGLPTDVMARFHRAVSEAGGGAQEVFVSNGEPVKEQIATGLETSGDMMSRAMSEGFTDMSEVQKFLDALDKNPIAKAMLSLIAPFGLLIAQWEGNEEMEALWRGIMGEDPGEGQYDQDGNPRQDGVTPNYSRDQAMGTAPKLSESDLADIEGIKVDAGRIAKWEGIDIATNHIGAASGHTIGCGYDLKYHGPDEIRRDWSPYFGKYPSIMNALVECSGKGYSSSRASRIRSAIESSGIPGGFAGFKKIVHEVGITVLKETTLKKYTKQTLEAFGPGLKVLSPEAQTALVGLVYNRGPGTSGGTRVDMLRIKQHMAKFESYRGKEKEFYDILAKHVLNMNNTMAHKWRGLEGLFRRRREEAALIRANPVFVDASSASGQGEIIQAPMPERE